MTKCLWRVCRGRQRRTRRATGDLLEVDIRRQGLAARVNLQDSDAALDVRPVDRNLHSGAEHSYMVHDMNQQLRNVRLETILEEHKPHYAKHANVPRIFLHHKTLPLKRRIDTDPRHQQHG